MHRFGTLALLAFAAALAAPCACRCRHCSRRRRVVAAEPPRCRRRCPRGTQALSRRRLPSLSSLYGVCCCVLNACLAGWCGLHGAIVCSGGDGLRVAMFFGRARPARWAFLSCISNSMLLNGRDHSSSSYQLRNKLRPALWRSAHVTSHRMCARQYSL